MSTKIIHYCRVSSREQESGYSLDAQKKLLNEYAVRHGFTVARVFAVSESASGKKQRETFYEMISYSIKNNIKNIACEKTDRLTRTMQYAVKINDWINADVDRRVHFVKENTILHRDSKSNEKFIWNIKVSVAQYYIDNLAEEVKKGQIGKLEAGYLPTQPKFGYKSAKFEGKNIHIIDETKASFIVRMFNLYATANYSISVLREILYKEGLTTRRGRKMSISAIAYILGDPFYYGALPWKGKILDTMGKHTPLISKDLFDNVQLVLSGKGAPKQRKHNFAFKKVLTCANCGGTMTGELQKGRVYYRCKGYGGCTLKSSIREDDIEKQIIGAFEIFQKLTENERKQVQQAVLDLHKEEAEHTEKTLQKLLNELQALKVQRDLLYEDRLSKRIGIDKWELKDREYDQRIAVIEEALTKQRQNQSSYFKVGSCLIDLAFKAEDLYQKMLPEKRRELLKLIFANLKVDGKKVLFSFVKPVEKLAKRIEDKFNAEIIREPQKSLKKKTANQFSQLFYSIECAQLESNQRPSA